MRKFISTLLILSTLSCFTTVVGSFAKDTTASDLSISYAFDLAKNKTGEAIDEIKYSLGKALNWTKSTAAWNATTYGVESAWNKTKSTTAWNTAAYGLESAWNWTKSTTAWKGAKYGVDTAFDWTKTNAPLALSNTKYGIGKALNWTKSTAAWNAATYGIDLAWNNAKFEAGKVYEWIIKMWCEYVGLGCQNNIGPNNQDVSKNVTEAKSEL